MSFYHKYDVFSLEDPFKELQEQEKGLNGDT